MARGCLDGAQSGPAKRGLHVPGAFRSDCASAAGTSCAAGDTQLLAKARPTLPWCSRRCSLLTALAWLPMSGRGSEGVPGEMAAVTLGAVGPRGASCRWSSAPSM
jgi:hypothetical protein